MRLVFFGSGAFGLPTFEQLRLEHDIRLVVSQPDRPAGRHRRLAPTPIAASAEQRGIATIKPDRVNLPEVIRRIRAIEAQAFVVIAYGQKLGPALLEGVFAINLHGSLLPRYRGAAPINWAMINGEPETGVSVIALADRMDAGEILGHAATPIDPLETAGELHNRLAHMGPPLILGVLKQFQGGCLAPQQQDETLATSAPKLSKADGVAGWNQPAARVRQRVHGLTPWPGCSIKLDGHPLRLARVEVCEPRLEHASPGLVLGDLSIACGVGSIRILEVQPPGGTLMSFDAYRNGQPVLAGMRAEPA